MLVKTTIRHRSASSSQSGLSTSYTPTEVDLMSIDEIKAINDPSKNRDDVIIIIRDCTPFVCRKLNLMEHKRWADVKASKAFWKNLNVKPEDYYRGLDGKTDDVEKVTP